MTQTDYVKTVAMYLHCEWLEEIDSILARAYFQSGIPPTIAAQKIRENRMARNG